MRTINFSVFENSGGSWMDKFNGVWTPVVLVILGFISFILPFLTAPTVCWCPAEFTISMIGYVNRKCWQNNIIQYKQEDDDFLSLEGTKPVVSDSDSGSPGPGFRTLYQWFPVILIVQALFFAVPYVLWRTLVSSSGMNINKVHGMAEGYSGLSLQDRQGVSKQLARYLNQWLEASPLKGIPWGLLTFITLFIKILFLVNISIQYALFDGFLKAGNVSSYGSQVLKNLIDKNGTVWQDSPTFPKSMLCFFPIRMIQNIQHWTVECFYYMNMYYEMIALFVWLWLCFTLIATVTSCVYYGLHIIIPVFRTRFVKRHLLASPNLSRHPTDNDISRFAGSTLGQDGVTVLRWISMVSSDLLVVDTIEHLWQLHHGGVDAPTVHQSGGAAPARPMAQSYPVAQHPPPIAHQAGVATPIGQSYPVAQPPPPTETLPSYYATTSPGGENIPLMKNPSAPTIYPKVT